jgi:hypothetical protein
MSVETTRSPEDVRALAKAWVERQLEMARARLGKAWPLHQDWVRDYLVAAVRQRLIERGWRIGS